MKVKDEDLFFAENVPAALRTLADVLEGARNIQEATITQVSPGKYRAAYRVPGCSTAYFVQTERV